MLTVLGGAARLARLLDRPTVAFVDSREASDYGCAMASSIGRGLTAAGVTVVAGASGPIAQAAHEGAQQTGASLCVVGDSLDAIGSSAADRAGRAATQAGCAISELPWGCTGRRWGNVAAERIVAQLGTVAVLVESAGEQRELWATRLAARVGAVPGMITNRLAAGPNALIAGGARLIADTIDVLDLLHEAGAPAPSPRDAAQSASARLSPRLRRVLDLVGEGIDGAERLAAADAAPARGGRCASTWRTAAALGELEALGLIVRSEHGRYVRRDPSSVRRR
jgi:DNA processing protein